MPLDPEVQKAIADTIKEQLPAMFGEMFKPITEQFEHQQHANKKLAESITELSNSIPQQFEDRFAKINPSLDFLSQLKAEAEAEEKPEAETKAKKDNSKDKGETEQLRKEYETRFINLQKQLEERDTEAKALRDADRKSRMRQDVLNQMRGGNLRPNTEEDLLTLLEKRGLVVEQDDKYFIKSTDKFGGQINAEFKDILPKMLESDFAHFSVPRGGTGTDATPASTRTSQTSQYNFEGMTAQEIYDKYRDNPEANAAYNQVLEQQYGKS